MDRVGQAERDGALHCVRAARSHEALVDHVAGVVDHVGVVAVQAAHRVGAYTAVQQVVAAQAVQQIVAAQATQRVCAGIAA